MRAQLLFILTGNGFKGVSFAPFQNFKVQAIFNSGKDPRKQSPAMPFLCYFPFIKA